MDKLTLTRREAAQAMGVAVATIDRLIRQNEITALRISPRRIVIPIKAFESWLENHAANHNA
jgi:excisionase family DNA binding protein